VKLNQHAGRNPAVVFWEPAEAGHCGAQGAEPMEYERRVVGWFESHRSTTHTVADSSPQASNAHAKE
jgi:hypothetical protein